jgi:hypothetical protein
MKKYKPVEEIKVGLDFGAGVTPVGRLAMRGRQIALTLDFLRDCRAYLAIACQMDGGGFFLTVS